MNLGIVFVLFTRYLAVTAKAYTLFATHFHELTRLSETVPTLANHHVTAVTEEDALTLLYRVQPGICDQSFGIHVAQMARFPPTVIEIAKRKLAELEDYQSMIDADSDSKKRKIIQEGEKIMEEVIEKCKDLASKNLSDSVLAEAVMNLKTSALKQNNPYIEALLCKS